MLRFTNCRLCDNGELIQQDLYVDKVSGKIVSKPSDSEYVQTIDLKGKIIAPGYIDIQNNGIYGLNFSALNAQSSPDEIARFKAFYKDFYAKVLPVYKRTRSRLMADSLGAHVEGPFINLKKKGCHPVETFVDANATSFDSIYGAQNLLENVTIVTAAPEIPGVMEEIPRLLENPNVVFSLGHTTSDHATGLEAISRGASMVTHLYNAMPQPHHRETGVVGLVTEPQAGQNTPYFGLICDGVHVAPSMCVLAFRANPDKCVLVTDAMHLIGLPDGTYKWDKQRIVKTGPSLYLEGTSTLAGAATDLADCVKNLVKWANIPLAQAVKTATNNAADSLRISHKGYLNEGCDADLVVLDDAGDVLQVYKLGVPVAQRDPVECVTLSSGDVIP
ncbi:hypothetical protein JCM33374_g1235 [Metschnikowia sp. JCM 33374]|nr:hypothetical protein JCM33374_g1235 [Metschnikowia sp. JCM 33374]